MALNKVIVAVVTIIERITRRKTIWYELGRITRCDHHRDGLGRWMFATADLNNAGMKHCTSWLCGNSGKKEHGK